MVLEQSSTKVTKYLKLDKDAVGEQPHTLECTREKRYKTLIIITTKINRPTMLGQLEMSTINIRLRKKNVKKHLSYYIKRLVTKSIMP